jgi:hypothetical protein
MAVPRAQWADGEARRAGLTLLDKLVGDGTLTGYGAYSNLIHQEGEPTHGTWFTATSEGKLLKALGSRLATETGRSRGLGCRTPLSD